MNALPSSLLGGKLFVFLTAPELGRTSLSSRHIQCVITVSIRLWRAVLEGRPELNEGDERALIGLARARKGLSSTPAPSQKMLFGLRNLPQQSPVFQLIQCIFDSKTPRFVKLEWEQDAGLAFDVMMRHPHVFVGRGWGGGIMGAVKMSRVSP